MTVMTGKLVSVTGEPFGGPGHAVKIYSRVTRVAQQDDAVILQLVERIPMRSPDDPVEPGDGTFVTSDMDPGPIRVELEGSSRHGEGWDINLPEPENGGQEEWSLAQLIGLQVDWDPVVVSRAEAAARASQQSSVVSREWATRAETAGEYVEGVVADGAAAVREHVEGAASAAEGSRDEAERQAGLAQGHREGAEEAEDSAHGAAGAAAEATTALIRDEMDAKVAEADQSAQLAGESAAASALSAGESATSAQEAGESAQAAGQHLQDTRDLKAGIDAWWLDDLLPTVDAVAADRAATQDDRRQTGEDRTATGGHLTEVERLHGEAEQARDDAREAAENAQTGAPPEGWQREDMHVDVREDLSRARSALQDVPDATGEARGVIRLSGDLGGTATSPTVPGLAGKVDALQVAAPGTAPVDAPGLVPRVSPGGALVVNEAPVGDLDAVSKSHLDERVSTRSPVGHSHDVEQIDGLDPAIRALIAEASSTHLWDGVSPWVAPWWAGPHDSVINLDSGEVHSVEDING